MVDNPMKGIAAQRQAVIYIDMALLGIMVWECCVTAWVDGKVLFGRRKFAWPFLLYWVTKYAALLFTISVNIQQGEKVDCQAVDFFMQTSKGIAMAAASSILMLRAIALSGRDLKITIPLVVAHLAQWAINLHNGFYGREHWGVQSTGKEGCVFYNVTWPYIRIQYTYTMAFDLLVLLVVCYQLFRTPSRSNLWKILFRDGLSYFIIAFALYLTISALAFQDAPINIIFCIADSTTVLVAMLACRSFVRLWDSKGPQTTVRHTTAAITGRQVSEMQFAQINNTKKDSLFDTTISHDVEAGVTVPIKQIMKQAKGESSTDDTSSDDKA